MLIIDTIPIANNCATTQINRMQFAGKFYRKIKEFHANRAATQKVRFFIDNKLSSAVVFEAFTCKECGWVHFPWLGKDD